MYIGALVIILLIPSFAGAQAFRYQPQSGTGAAQANAFSAQADDPSALYYNPAGMTQLPGVQFSSSSQFIGATVTFQNATGQKTTGDGGSRPIAWPPPSQMYLTANLRDLGWTALTGWVFGIGINTPYALKSHYSDSSPFNSAVTSAAIPMIAIKPTIAYQLTEFLSIGVGADIYTFTSLIGDGHIEQKATWPGGGVIPPGASVEFNGKGTAAGFNASLMYHALMNADHQPIANIGLVYRSQAGLPLQGQMLVNGTPVDNGSSSLILPPMYTAAMAIWPIRDRQREWKIEMDIDYVGWKAVNNFDVHLSTGGVIPKPAHWKTVPTLSFGTEYKWVRPKSMPNWQIAARAGYTYTQSQVPDATFNPGTPSLNSHTIATGVGLTCLGGGTILGVIPCGSSQSTWMPKGIGADLAFQYWLYSDRNVQGNQNPTVDGTYKAKLYLGAVSLRLMF